VRYGLVSVARRWHAVLVTTSSRWENGDSFEFGGQMHRFEKGTYWDKIPKSFKNKFRGCPSAGTELWLALQYSN